MDKIPLRDRAGTVVAEALVDDADASWLNATRWHLASDGYARALIEGRLVLMHRLILGLTDPRIEGEHRDRNPLNNQRFNLRPANRSQNMQNSGSHRLSSSLHRGVSYHRHRQKWQANARLDGRLYYLGLYSSEEEAAAVAASWRSTHMPYSSDWTEKDSE